MNMPRNEALEWLEIGAAATALAWESADVIALRMVGAAAGGPRAQKEAVRMVSEKMIALVELQAGLLAGAMGATPTAAARGTLSHYARKVAANRRRLMSI